MGKRDLNLTYIRPPQQRFSFPSELLQADEQHIVLSHRISPSKPFFYRGEQVIGSGYTSVWFLFQGQPFDVGRFYRPDGAWTGYYVDVLEPVRWQDAEARSLQPIVDLFLDLWIAPDGSYQVLDEDEFEEALAQGAISQEQGAQARAALDWLVAETEQGSFPPAMVREFAP